MNTQGHQPRETSGNFSGCSMNASAFWTAVAERSGDTAFGRRTAVAAVSNFYMETGATPVLRKLRGASLPAAVLMPERARPRAQQSPKRQAAANFPKRRVCGRCCGRDGRTPQRLACGGAAFDGIFKFLAAGAAGARALGGGRRSGHVGKFLRPRRQDAKTQGMDKFLCAFAAWLLCVEFRFGEVFRQNSKRKMRRHYSLAGKDESAIIPASVQKQRPEIKYKQLLRSSATVSSENREFNERKTLPKPAPLGAAWSILSPGASRCLR